MSATALKVIILILFIAMVISLFGGFHAFIKDRGSKDSKQNTLLGIRAAIALSLMAVLVYGIFSGKLGSKAPWDQRKSPDYQGPLVPAPEQAAKPAQADPTAGQ